MDLVLWRHAQAHEAPAGGDDLARSLTPRGEADAARMGAWLDQHLPPSARILCSPARRCEQTARALPRAYEICPALAPDAAPEALLAAAQWPDALQVPQGAQTVVLVGHQPTLGRVVAQVLGLAGGECTVRKGAVWWLRARERDGVMQAVVVAVIPPQFG